MPAKDKPKSIDELMLYLRDVKGINISGHEQKQKLMNMGYYHGYKGYRYIGNPNKKAPFSDFSQLAAVYEFDTQIKAIFYPHVVFIETALKNYVLESIISYTESDDLTVIYNKVLDRHSEYYPGPRSNSTGKNRSDAEKRYRSALKRRLELRNRIYKIQSDAFGNDNRIAMHYLYNDNSIPIWALFELMSLGEFGHFVSCINKDCRIAPAASLSRGSVSFHQAEYSFSLSFMQLSKIRLTSSLSFAASYMPYSIYIGAYSRTARAMGASYPSAANISAT